MQCQNLITCVISQRYYAENHVVLLEQVPASIVFCCTLSEKCMTSSNTHHGIELLSLQCPSNGFIDKSTLGRMLALKWFLGSEHFGQRGCFWFDLAW